jgi:hypothetical protein
VLEDRKEKHSLNVSAFCRRAIEHELQRPIIEIEPERQIHGAQAPAEVSA